MNPFALIESLKLETVFVKLSIETDLIAGNLLLITTFTSISRPLGK